MNMPGNGAMLAGLTVMCCLQGDPTMAAEDGAKNTNLLSNGSFELGAKMPDGCATWAAYEAVEPEFAWDSSVSRSGKRSLRITNPGKPGCYGRWEVLLEGIKPQTHYRVTCYAKTRDVDDMDRSVNVALSWLGPGTKREVFHGRRGWHHVGRVSAGRGGWHRFQRVVRAHTGAKQLRIDLSLRWTGKGTVWFDDLSVVEVPAPKSRPVRIAASGAACRARDPVKAAEFWAKRIAAIGKRGCDLFVMPEYWAGQGAYDDAKLLLSRSTPVPGPATDIVAAAAKAAGTFVVYNLVENGDGVLYNTSVLVGRDGTIVGTYRKVHLAIYESWIGITPGTEFPVFDTPIGRIGLAICWDEMFPEVPRILARKGADIIAVSGGSEMAVSTNARVNAVLIAHSNTAPRCGSVYGPDGKVLDHATDKKSYALTTYDLAQAYFRLKFDTWRARTLNERRPEAYGPLLTPAPGSTPHGSDAGEPEH